MRFDDKYDDILELPHHVSKTRPQMPMSDRAAQFAPFAALTGYEAAIRETGRRTEAKIDLGEDALAALNQRYLHLVEVLPQRPHISITYFCPDERKSGGAYITMTGIVAKADAAKRRLTLEDGTEIPLDDILTLEGEVFASLE